MAISLRTRMRRATLVQKTPGPRSGSVDYRFPMPDRKRARNALARLSVAQDLTPRERKLVAQRAANVLGEVTPGARRYGVTRLTKTPAQAIHQQAVHTTMVKAITRGLKVGDKVRRRGTRRTGKVTWRTGRGSSAAIGVSGNAQGVWFQDQLVRVNT